MEIDYKHNPETYEFTCSGPWETKGLVDVDMCNKTSNKMPDYIFTVIILRTFVKTGVKNMEDAVIEFEDLLPVQYRPVVDVNVMIQTCHLNHTNNGLLNISTDGKIKIYATDLNINKGMYKPGEFPQGFYETKVKYISKVLN